MMMTLFTPAMGSSLNTWRHERRNYGFLVPGRLSRREGTVAGFGLKLDKKMGWLMGFEPTTTWTTTRGSAN